MNKDWRDELITKGAAFDALTEVESHYEFEDGHDHLMRWAKTKIFALPSAQPTQNNTSNALVSLDCVDRQAAIDALKELTAKEESYVDPFESVFKMLDDLPSALPQRIKGRWIDVTKTGGAELWKCSECGELELEDSYYCPNCGADMRGDEDE